MRSLQQLNHRERPVVVQVPDPVPTGEQVLVRVLAAGLCHTDLGLMALGPDQMRWPLPFAIGHEVVGVIEQIGPDVQAESARVGVPVAVFGAWGCGDCTQCARGRENYCPDVASWNISRPGLGGPGGIADLVLVDHPRHLIPLDGLDPVAAVGLTDAGLTSYHAISSELDRLPEGSTAAVVGVGGLGHVAIQLLKAMTPATVLAIDIAESKRDVARESGADQVLIAPDDEQLRAVVGHGVDVVFDFVGTDQSVQQSLRLVSPGGAVSVVGAGGGRVQAGFDTLPRGVRISFPFWGGLDDLRAVLDLARQGRIAVDTTQYQLDQVVQAYDDLDAGRIPGRAVVVP